MAYNYNIRCRMCKVGFNPKGKEAIERKLCPHCLKIRKKQYQKFLKTHATTA